MSWLACYLTLCTGLLLLQWDVTCEEFKNVDSAVKLQDVVVLKCAFPQRSKMIQLSWEKNINGVKHNIAVYNPKLGEHIFFPYNQSVTFLSPSISGDIKFRATAADEGNYQCSINTFPQGMLLKRIAIINPANFSRSRVADTHVQLVPGNNVTLFCGHSNGDNIAQVTWKRVAEDEINTLVNFIHSQLFVGYGYRRRITFTYSPSENISLTIQNVTTNDVGRYSCHVITSNGKWTKVFDVDVEREQSDVPPPRIHDTSQVLTEGQNYPERTDLIMFLIIGAVALGILLFVIIVTIICVKRVTKWKKNKRQLQKNHTERNDQRANQNSYSMPDVYDGANSRAMEHQEEAIYANL